AAPLIYVDFVDYDEIAHHSGVDRIEARDAIDGLDRILALIEKASLDAPRPYRFVVLSDHGQTPGAMFRARFGKTLDELVHELVGDEKIVHGATKHIEHWGRLGSLVSESAGPSRMGGRLSRMSLPAEASGPRDNEIPDVVVAASGNLAHVSFPDIQGRASKEAIEGQIGSHGGLGGWQTRAFILHPAEWKVDGAIVGATSLHERMRAWLTAMGG